MYSWKAIRKWGLGDSLGQAFSAWREDEEDHGEGKVGTDPRHWPGASGKQPKAGRQTCSGGESDGPVFKSRSELYKLCDPG